LRTFDVSERRACSTPGADRTSVRYRSRRPDDAPIRARLRELAAIRRRFGYRRLHILLVREGLVRTTRSCGGFIARKAFGCAGVLVASVRWEKGTPMTFRRGLTSVAVHRARQTAAEGLHPELHRTAA